MIGRKIVILVASIFSQTLFINGQGEANSRFVKVQ